MPPLSVLSWNTMGRPWHGIQKTFLDEFSRKKTYAKITAFLEKANTDIVCLQEASHYFPLHLREYLNYAGYKIAHENHGNLIASKFPFVESGEIVFENPEKIRRLKMTVYPSACSWADIQLPTAKIRIYNCQFRIRRTGIRERLLALQRILEHAQMIEYPIVVCGDMNTTIPRHGLKRKVIQLVHRQSKSSLVVDGKYHASDERHAFNSVAEKFDFTEILDLKQTTWALPYTSLELFKLKLDWFLIKNAQCSEYELGPYITDHRPILAQLHLP